MLGRLLVSRVSGIVAGVVILVIFGGCMSLQFGGGETREEVVNSPPPETPVSYVPGYGLLEQTGTETVGAGHSVLDVYYAIPYVSPPHLTISSTFDEAKVIEQRRDHFRVKNTGAFARSFHWKANGVKVLLTPPPVATPAPEPPARLRLPAEPVPVAPEP
jgi:hypothetical protein